ncbi:PPC domain-containing protein [Romeria aff. gracilis LEGE 07310]|uniref:PPC domain-containing protein n=1 Tax=Vasconcelosia minhoensis LEGE 07310 TaxID=915328 RepID=A0A8J7AGM0_9CYAN|nr:PPC domain-containing protein [Romeria gracilis]MBE9078791.1 PPC domain-containing protein [Romeria aff. gracilis LEGE 07310]
MKLSRFFSYTLLVPAALVMTGLTAGRASAQLYSPISLPNSREITDTLSEQDIPTGFGGFARDYVVELQEGDQITIDAISEEFDTLVTLMNTNGITISENDDGPDGTTNSLLFARITETGKYTVRVRSYAGEGSGEFSLKLARLRPIE